MRHLNTSWLWAQEKEASRELQYHKFKNSDNSADNVTRECKREHGESVTGNGELVQSKWTNRRVDTPGLAQKNLQTQPGKMLHTE